MSEHWIEVGPETALTEGLRLHETPLEKLLVGRLEGKVVACTARCPHAGAVMERPETEGSIVTCPLHGWRFDMAREGCEIHGYRPLAPREVQVRDGVVFVRLASTA